MEIIEPQNLQEHFVQDEKTGKYACDKCNKQFPDVESLYQHNAKDHGTSYQCDVCKEFEAKEANLSILKIVVYACCYNQLT
jgi:predicted SprT family Zn-dependent metalloprotease